MARKPPPMLPFPEEPSPGQGTTAPLDTAMSEGGGADALQDDGARTAPPASTDLRAAPPRAEAAGGDGSLRGGTEPPTRRVGTAAGRGQAGQQPEADRQ